MLLKVCDRCGCEIKVKNNNPGAIKFGWTREDGTFTSKIAVEPFDLCDACMQQLVVFLGCTPERVGMRIKSENNEIVDRINKNLEKLKAEEEKEIHHE